MNVRERVRHGLGFRTVTQPIITKRNMNSTTYWCTWFQVSPLPKNRSPLTSNGSSGSSIARWSSANANANPGSRPCQTYENLEFLYGNPPANSAPAGASRPPPLPAKSIQRGKSLCMCTFNTLNNIAIIHCAVCFNNLTC